MTSPILGNRARASFKERLDLLESQFINLKGSLLAELKNHISAENGMEVESVAGTNNIEDYNTMEIFNDNNKTEKIKKDLKQFLEKEMEEIYTRVKDDLVDNLRDQLMAEQHVLFIKFRDEMAVKLNKEVGNMKAKLQRDLQVNNKAEPTMEEQQKMLVNMLANFKVSVCSRGTQVEEGELPLEKSTANIQFEPIDDISPEDSVSLLQGTP